MPTGSAGRRPPYQRGFTYVGLLFAVVLIGITLATVGVVWSTQIRREKEVQLLFVGDQYRAAIERYRNSGGVLPATLEELIEDKRFPVVRRHLRRLYPDPMTGLPDWTLVLTADQRIMGVASRSTEKPIKVAGFPKVDAEFEQAGSYADWRFIAQVRGRNGQRVTPGQPIR